MFRLESSSRFSTICNMTTTETEGQYLFPHSWEGEGDRLMALSALLDPVTKRHLAPLGLAPGWRCLEVGAGTGTIAGWLAEVVGEKGSVLATDLSLDLMEARGVEAENLELRRHDIINDPLPEGAFDLIHSRLVLEHLPARLDVLAKLSRALAPGGWLVLDKSYQDVGFFASFRCASGCKAGVLLRGEKTAQGMKGIYMSLAEGDVAAYRVTLSGSFQVIQLRWQSGQ